MFDIDIECDKRNGYTYDIENQNNMKRERQIFPIFSFTSLSGGGRTDRRLHDLQIAMYKISQRLLNDHHPLQAWYYGHFHSSQIEYIDNIKFCCLNIDEIKEL